MTEQQCARLENKSRYLLGHSARSYCVFRTPSLPTSLDVPLPMLQKYTLHRRDRAALCMSVMKTATASPRGPLHNRLKLPGIAQRVLDDHATRTHHVLLCRLVLLFLLREVYPSVLRHPAALLCELDHCTLRVEKEQVLRVRDWQRGVSMF